MKFSLRFIRLSYYICLFAAILIFSCAGPKTNSKVKTLLVNEMVVLKGPIMFNMGSPVTEQYRTPDELQHQVRIPRSFAISKKEVTVAQFQKFLEANPEVKRNAALDSSKNPSIENKKIYVFSPEPGCPQIFITWYEAARYCNWLSKMEGIPPSEWVYPENIRSGMELPVGYLNKKGYRLPTEAEWEYAARGGSTASRFYGDSDEELAQYAWYSKNPPQKKGDKIDPDDPNRTFPVGSLKPNQYGLFDVYGNVWEWCDSRRLEYEPGIFIDEPARKIIITDSVAMIRRGGSFAYSKQEMRSAHRGAKNYFPNQRRDNVGFRVAKTVL
jgi:formylglycine-generating enzyme required for sulfatase activity